MIVLIEGASITVPTFDCGFSQSMQHTVARASGRGVAHDSPTTEAFHRQREGTDVGSLAARRDRIANEVSPEK